jgi:hypothetical protein
MKYLFQISIFFAREVNKKLRDENDTLRATIESKKSIASHPDVRID